MWHPASPRGLDAPPLIGPEPFDSPGVRWVVARAEDELVARYGFAAEHERSLDSDAFAPPRGAFLVARIPPGPHPVGGVGLRAVSPDTGEVKRLWVDGGRRAQGIGRALMDTLEVMARRLGYRTLRLETGPLQPEAVALYAATGWTRQTEDWGGGGCIPDYSIRFAKELP